MKSKVIMALAMLAAWLIARQADAQSCSSGSCAAPARVRLVQRTSVAAPASACASGSCVASVQRTRVIFRRRR